MDSPKGAVKAMNMAAGSALRVGTDPRVTDRVRATVSAENPLATP